ncbi:NAD(P)-binding protein [Aquibacillus halophilus]|uniref:NAD(P)-binding protein n=1 Tax=Aquibacillus halophilus TaxID=930132 RepID=A0A6A8DEY8_9BACI|nr:NAD(P)/FAD-dependent oxidoreductase [Aquibacillus halophilus]MRH44265.1 NAD(P)-binding protein [Aquibacillus halophilus]
MIYDCVIVGGGIAGLQAAIQLGRYQHKVLVFDSNDGRSNLCRCYHNLIGWPDGVSGEFLRTIGKKQSESYGIEFSNQVVEEVNKDGNEFIVVDRMKNKHYAKRILFATGVKDNFPDFENLYPCLGISVYICPDCDGYEVKGKRTLVLGSGNVGATMALSLFHWTNELIYINHEQAPVSQANLNKLKDIGTSVYNQSITKLITDNSHIQGVELVNGEKIEANHAFVAFGGNKVRSDLAKNLGAKLHKNNHILVNPRTMMTTIDNVWAAGDVVPHSEQVTIAMGDGLQAAIWIHKTLS